MNELNAYIQKYGINHPEDNYYPIVAAARMGKLDIVEYLVLQNADINARGYKKRTALMSAIKGKHVEVAKYLIAQKADLKLKDEAGHTAMQIAVASGCYEQLKTAFGKNDKVEVDGPYIFQKNGNFQVLTILRDADGKVLKDEKNLDPAVDDLQAACYDNSGNKLFNFQFAKEHLPTHDVYDGIEKVCVISDIEGNFNEFRVLLLEAGVINHQYEWTFGKGHLVLLGDFFDRGKYVTEVLWLVYWLEQQAASNDGRVHFILGNHEEMNLKGDVRYVDPKYKSTAIFIKKDYMDFFAPNTVMGDWLRSKSAIVKVNDVLYCHAGISPEFVAAGYSIQRANQAVRLFLGQTREKGKLSAADHEMLSSKKGPLWYRGIARQNIDAAQVNAVLKHFEANKIIIGHTTVDQITATYGGKVINVDVKHSEGTEVSRALLIENGEYQCIGLKYRSKLF